MTMPTLNAKRHAADFRDFLSEIGITQEQMNAAAVALPDPVHAVGDYKHPVLPSAIEGLGVFSDRYFDVGDRACTLLVGEKWTVYGRYINHDPEPNIVAAYSQGVLAGIAIREINQGDEITLNYRQVKDALLTDHEGSKPHSSRINEMEK